MSDQDRRTDTTENADWEALARFVAGEAAPGDGERVQRLLSADPASAALVAAVQGHAAEVAAPTAAETEHALLAVKARRAASAPQVERRGREASPRTMVLVMDAYRRRWQDARLRAAAAVLVVAGAGLVWRTMAGPAVNTTAALNSPSHFASAVGAIDSLSLPDGSRVLLGPGSELTLATGYASGTREVTLKGEARFDVVHDGSHPFIVRTSSASFRDIGTVFSVHSDGGDGARVSVSAGSVAVVSTGNRSQVTLKAGDRAQVAVEGAVRVERAAATDDDVAWTNGRLIFRDASVEQVRADLRRWYGVELVVDGVLARKTVTSTFERHDAARDVGSVVAALMGGRLELAGDTLRIVAAAPGAQK